MRINLYAGPCAGKSTVATLVAGQLKLEGHDIELVSEYVKDWAYEHRVPDDWDQLYLFAKQHRKEKRLCNEVDHIISDSPLALQVAYAYKYKCVGADEIKSLCMKWEKVWPGTHLFLDRGAIQYKLAGRYETLAQAKEMDERIKECLNELGIKYEIVPSDHIRVLKIVRDLISR